MGLSGPAVVKVGTGHEATSEEIGGSLQVCSERGLADHLGESEQECLQAIRDFLSYFPSSSDELPPSHEARPALIHTPAGARETTALVSDNHRRGYDMRRVADADRR